MSDSLVVDFQGPVAFRFAKDWAYAYLPNCSFHRCNVLTDTDDVSLHLCRHHTFCLNGPTAGKTTISNPDEVISMPWDWVQRPSPLPSYPDCRKECYCIFQLPPPDYVFGLRAEYAKITIPPNPEPQWEGCYARGLRFYYCSCPSAPTITPVPPVTLHYPYGSSTLEHLNPTCLHPASGSDVKYRIEIRFRDLNPVEDEDNPHADAGMCSATMRALFPPLDQWVVSFEDTNNMCQKAPEDVFVRVGGSGPVDCGANGFLFNDGGLPL